MHINVARYLDLNGVRPEEMSLVEMGFPDMNAALANGALDLADQSDRWPCSAPSRVSWSV